LETGLTGFSTDSGLNILKCADSPIHPPLGDIKILSGLSLPASDFFKGLLEYYDTEYLNLNPNGIFHTSVFVHFCEAFLGIKPHWVLFRKFFRVKP
jgi:hypothetical protein